MRTDDPFLRFVHQHSAALARLAHQLTHDRTAAEDLVQDVLVTAYRRWDRVGRADSSYAYVRRMLVNHHLNAQRRRLATSRWPADGDVADVAAPVDEIVERDEVWRALSRLTDRQRAVLVLRHYEQCDDAEIAAVLGCRRATVRSLAARGLAALRDDLASPAVPGPPARPTRTPEDDR